MRKKFTSFFILLFLVGSIHFSMAESVTVSGNVSGIWSVDTVNVADNINLRETESLQIMPGVIVNFLGEYYFTVRGSLKALGTSLAPVVFTTADTTGFSIDTIPDGGWKGIWIEEINPMVDSILFQFCHFEFGKAVNADSVHGYGGAIIVRNTDKVRISQCVFQNNYAYFNGGAVYLENADIIVSRNVFRWNRAGQVFAFYGYGGGLCADYGEQVIEKNTFFQNSSTGIGGGLTIRFTDGPVFNNVFENNYSALGGGMGILHVPLCRHFIANNLVVNNGATFFGSGTSTNNCSPTYVNNTIVDNWGAAGAFYCKDSVVPVLYNNIIWGNAGYGGQVYLWDLLSQPNFYFNDIQGGKENFQGTGGSAFSGEYENNIDDDPLFAGSGDYPFALQNESPCVNAGTTSIPGFSFQQYDLAGNTRIFGNSVDMGAYENQLVVNTKDDLSFPDAVFYEPSPNPATHQVYFSFYLLQPSQVRLEILDECGGKIETVTAKHFSVGLHHISWNLTANGLKLPDGIYFCSLKVDGRILTKKLIFR